MSDLRTLLYPLGFVATALFAARFLLQWLQSESKGRSVVSKTFWILSLVANCLMGIHFFIQVQYPLCLIQGVNAVISWRNLDMMQKHKRRLSFVVGLFLITLVAITVGFMVQGEIAYGHLKWTRTPTMPWDVQPGEPVSWGWHLIGFLGAAIFATRFWWQWWTAERRQISALTEGFWWSSLLGAALALIYFIRIDDWVNIIGYGLGIIPYVRNIVLVRRNYPFSG